MSNRKRLLAIYDEFPFQDHPFWRGVTRYELSLAEVLRGEVQHYLRTKAGQLVRRDAMLAAKALSETLWKAILGTYIEECSPSGEHESHLVLIQRLLTMGGVTVGDLEAALPTPGNSAAMALYADIARRGPECHIIGAGTIEHFYAQLSPKIFEAYTGHYRMAPQQAETYRLHGPMDREHADRALSAIDEAVSLSGWVVVEQAVRDAFVATSLHYDGMLQAATGTRAYWDGSTT